MSSPIAATTPVPADSEQSSWNPTIIIGVVIVVILVGVFYYWSNKSSSTSDGTFSLEKAIKTFDERQSKIIADSV